jgi:hypothetical protein
MNDTLHDILYPKAKRKPPPPGGIPVIAVRNFVLGPNAIATKKADAARFKALMAELVAEDAENPAEKWQPPTEDELRRRDEADRQEKRDADVRQKKRDADVLWMRYWALRRAQTAGLKLWWIREAQHRHWMKHRAIHLDFGPGETKVDHSESEKGYMNIGGAESSLWHNLVRAYENTRP